MTDDDLFSEIKNLNESWMNDFINGDAEAVGSHYTDDAISLAPGEDPGIGKEAIIAYWGKSMKSGVGGLNIKSKEVQESGDLAFEIGETDLIGSDSKIITVSIIWLFGRKLAANG